MTVNNLLSYQESREKLKKNKKIILNFLLKEKYSTSKILGALLGIKTRSGIWKILHKMEQEFLIKSYEVNQSLVLWGISQHGIHAAVNGEKPIADWSYFEPSKVNFSTLDHQFDGQLVHVSCLTLGVDYTPGRSLGSRDENDKIPDGIIHYNGHTFAVEVERHTKSKRRYDSIIYNYLKCIKDGTYNRILYVSPDAERSKQIQNAMHSVGTITMTVDGRKKKLELKEGHFRYFDYISLDKIESYIQSQIVSLPPVNS